jgi:hypothetical protein
LPQNNIILVARAFYFLGGCLGGESRRRIEKSLIYFFLIKSPKFFGDSNFGEDDKELF